MQHCNNYSDQQLSTMLDTQILTVCGMGGAIIQDWLTRPDGGTMNVGTAEKFYDVFPLYNKVIRLYHLVQEDRERQLDNLLLVRNKENQQILKRLQPLMIHLYEALQLITTLTVDSFECKRQEELQKQWVCDEKEAMKSLYSAAIEMNKYADSLTADVLHFTDQEASFGEENAYFKQIFGQNPDDQAFHPEANEVLITYMHRTLSMLAVIITTYQTLLDPKQLTPDAPYYTQLCQLYEMRLNRALHQHEATEACQATISEWENQALIRNDDRPLTSTQWKELLKEAKTTIPQPLGKIYLAYRNNLALMAYQLRRDTRVNPDNIHLLLDRMAQIRYGERKLQEAILQEQASGLLPPSPMSDAFTHPRLIQTPHPGHHPDWKGIHATIYRHLIVDSLQRQSQPCRYLWTAVLHVLTWAELLEENCSINDFVSIMTAWYPGLPDDQRCTPDPIRTYGTEAFRQTRWSKWDLTPSSRMVQGKQKIESLERIQDLCQTLYQEIEGHV